MVVRLDKGDSVEVGLGMYVAAESILRNGEAIEWSPRGSASGERSSRYAGSMMGGEGGISSRSGRRLRKAGRCSSGDGTSCAPEMDDAEDRDERGEREMGGGENFVRVTSSTGKGMWVDDRSDGEGTAMENWDRGDRDGGVAGQPSDEREDPYDNTEEDGEDDRKESGERGEKRVGVAGADPRREYEYGEDGVDIRRAVPAVMGWAEAGLVSRPGPWFGLRGEEDWSSGRGRERKCGGVGGKSLFVG
jgi:hypothetical protein